MNLLFTRTSSHDRFKGPTEITLTPKTIPQIKNTVDHGLHCLGCRLFTLIHSCDKRCGRVWITGTVAGFFEAHQGRYIPAACDLMTYRDSLYSRNEILNHVDQCSCIAAWQQKLQSAMQICTQQQVDWIRHNQAEFWRMQNNEAEYWFSKGIWSASFQLFFDRLLRNIDGAMGIPLPP